MYEILQDLPVEKIRLFTKGYTQPQLIEYLKKEYGNFYPFVANQLQLVGKAKKKLPTWVEFGCFFTPKSLEQCSSPALASFKASLLSGQILLDLSGGLGVDDVSFSKVFNQVISIDSDEELNQLVRHNLRKLHVKNVQRITSSAENYLIQHPQKVTVIYVDADRRSHGQSKSALLKDATPDVLGLMPLLLNQASEVMLKLSPLIDITYLMNTFNHIQHIYVAGVQNEVKEVLVLLNKEASTQKENITAIQLTENGEVEFKVNMDVVPQNIAATQTEAWFYEPSNMVIKAGLSKELALKYGLVLPAKNSHFMTGEQYIQGYFGRTFKIINAMPFGKSGVKQYLYQHQITKANVSARNFVSGVDEIRKTFQIKEGGDDYLFFTTNTKGDKLFYHCVKP